MIGAHSNLLLMLTMASLASAYCPKNRIHNQGGCNYKILCSGNVRGVRLPDQCRRSVNQPFTVEVTLHGGVENIDENVDQESLSDVTQFRLVASVWPKTTLSILKCMPKLNTVILTDDQIQEIDGKPFYTLKYLQFLDLSRNYLTDISNIFQFEDHPNSLRQLLLASNAIAELPRTAFTELTNLIELDLSNNDISDLREQPFSNLKSLEILRLDNNMIKDLNGSIDQLTSLKHLYLRRNQIQNIDGPSLKIINYLQTLDISGNQLMIVNPMLFLRHWDNVAVVFKILLSRNQITSIPNATCRALEAECTNNLLYNGDVTTEVDLSNNCISDIDFDAFESIIKLTRLDLSLNSLNNFIVNPEDLKDLTHLNLSFNYLTELNYDTFSQMPNLINLDLTHNKLSHIHADTFGGNCNLKYVNMSLNELYYVNSLHIRMFTTDGGVLDLSNNGICRFDIPFGEALHLNFLILSSNDIDDAASVDLSNQNELKVLEIRNNSIEVLTYTSLRLPSSVIHLDLTGNKISEIGPSAFHRLSNLKSLFLGFNCLKEIQFGAFQGLDCLTDLDLSLNKISYLDSNVMLDLKSLKVLALRSNGLFSLDYTGWLGHRNNLKVYLDDNTLSCEWLAEALTDFNNGYSPMKPTVLRYYVYSSNSLEGIPCVQDSKELGRRLDVRSSTVLADERLLAINQKILEAVKEQTSCLRLFMNQFKLKI